MQRTPTVTRADVERVAHRQFSAAEAAQALEILEAYGKESYEGGRDRVHLAVLKLAEGKLDQLREHVAGAKLDPRDVIAAAEYPLAVKRWSQTDPISIEEQQRMYDADWEQYKDWLGQ